MFGFSQWLNAYASGDERLQAFYRARFRPEFKAAFEPWLAADPRTNPDAAPTPFATPQYQLATRTQAADLDRQADARFAEGQRAKVVSDSFIGATVILDGVKADRWRILVGKDAEKIDQLVRQTPEQAYDVEFFQKFAAEIGWKVAR